MLEAFKIFGKIAIDNSDANKALKETASNAKGTADTISKSNQSTKSSNQSTGSSFGNLKSRVAEYKSQGLSTSQAWRQASQDMKSSTEDAGNGMTSAFKKVGAAIATYLTVDAIKNFGLGCIQAAADASAMESQFSQVFGDLEGKASQSLSKIADTAGISENRMNGSFTKIAAFAKTTGMDTESALALSERAMVAVADSAAFYDRSLEETTESIQSFLKGNYENDAALGLSCTEVTRNAAANKLYGKSFNDLSESQKQLTLLQMVEDANKASGALGQAARESDTWTNVTGNLKQSWTDFQAVIGSNVLPLAIDVVKKMVSIVEEWSEKLPELIEWCKEHETTLTLIAIAAGTLAVAIGAYTIAQKAATIATTLATAASTAFGTVMAFITSPITLVVAAIGALIAIGVLLYKNWDVVSAKAKELWTNVKEYFSKLKESISNAVENAKAAAVNKFNEMKAGVVNKVNELKTNAVNKFNELKTGAIQKFSDLKSGAASKFNEIKSGITNKIQAARDAVGSAIDKMKSFFNFTWSLPKIKLPHFSISGKFSLNPPSVPKFSIEWYKKAMNNPMIMNSPTIFGYNPATGQYRGGGEAGSEVVSGTNTLMNMIGEVVEEKTAGQNERIIEILIAILHAITGGNEELLRALLAGQTIKLNEREFGRAVREYA